MEGKLDFPVLLEKDQELNKNHFFQLKVRSNIET